MEPLHDNDELKDAPFLRSLPKADPFEVPDGFFDRFPHQVQATVTAQRAAASRGWSFGTSIALRIAGVTAIVALIATASFFFMRAEAGTDEIAATEITIAPNEIDLDMMDDQDLFAMIDDSPELISEAGEGLNHDEMAAYLENEELPLDLLIEEL